LAGVIFFSIVQILQLPALTDNYIFILYDSERNSAAVIDPAFATPVIECLADLRAELVAIFHTHHHHDHIGGNRELIARFPEIIVYGGLFDRGRIPYQQVFLNDGDHVIFGDRTADVLFLPGHTRAHIAYYFPPATEGNTGDLFCGDTLFAGGCGRLREGTPAQMVKSLARLRNLPDNTHVWCAHEYTLNNLRFALTVDPDNHKLQKRYARTIEVRRYGKATIPSILGLEKLTNPFLRWDAPEIQSYTDSEDSVESFARLRSLKDRF
jgi:hydroxyacylglutathione hydrolase